MKKSKLSITLVTSFIAAMALTACKDVTKSDQAVVTFKTYSGEEVELLTDNVYNKYRGTSNGISMFYDKILEVLIRWEFEHGTDKNGGKTGFDKGDMNYEEIVNYAKNQVQEQKDKAKANAKSNKETSYKDEWQSILDSYKVEDETGLQEHFIYEKEKEIIKNWYAGNDEKAEELKAEFIGLDDAGDPIPAKVLGQDADGQDVKSKVSAAMPYHVRHILVKVDEASDSNAKFYKGTVSEAQAKLLANTVNALASGKYTFSEVAKLYSEDGSASSGGDVGIMTNAATSGSLGMVNEFQLGIYAYDNLFDETNKADAKKDNIRKGLGITDTVATEFANTLARVPYEAIAKIGKYAEATTDVYGNKIANGSATLYPRNILWNKYLNLHNIFLITDKESGSSAKFNTDKAAEEFSELEGAGAGTIPAGYTRFENGILVDEQHRPIIGVRSQYGIHFMVIERSMYDYDGRDANNTSKLSEYYSTKLPGEDGYKEDSYVGYIVSQSAEDYKTRANDVKSKITSFDPTYDYRLYQWLTTEIGELKFSDNAAGLGAEIVSYISALQNSNVYKQEEGLEKVWRTYDELLDVQEYNRSAQFKIVDPTSGSDLYTKYLTRLVSEAAADAFIKLYEGNGTQADYEAFAEGGKYYYYA